MSSVSRILLSLLIVLGLSGAAWAFANFQSNFVGYNPLDLTGGHDYVWLTDSSQLKTLSGFPWATTLFEKELPALSVWGKPNQLLASDFLDKLRGMMGQDNGAVWVEGETPLFVIPFTSHSQAQEAIANFAAAYNLPPGETINIDPWVMGAVQSFIVLAPTETDIQALPLAKHGLPHDKHLRVKMWDVAMRAETLSDDKIQFQLEGLPVVPTPKLNPASKLTQLTLLDPLVAFYSSDLPSLLGGASSKFPALGKDFSNLGLDFKGDFTVYLKKNFAFVLLSATRNSQDFPGIAVVSEVSGASRTSLETALREWKKELQDQVTSFPAITFVTLPDGTTSRELASLKQAPIQFEQIDHKDFVIEKLVVPSTTSDTLPVLGLAYTIWKNYFIVANDESVIIKIQAALSQTNLPGRAPTPHLFEAKNLSRSYNLLSKYFELMGEELPETLRSSQMQNLSISFFGGSEPVGSVTLSK